MTPPAAVRVGVIALDAMDAGLALRLAADGAMPNLARLLEQGWSRPATNSTGLLVGSVWPTFWSGRGPGHHGFYCFRQVVNGTYDVERRTPADVKAAPLWEVLSRAGRRCAVIDAPMSALLPDINGVQTVEWGAHDRILPFTTAPETLRATILSEFGEHPVARCDTFTEQGDPRGLREALRRSIAAKEHLAETVFADGPWDLFVVGYAESHCAGHQFWSLHDPAHPKHDAGVRVVLGDPLVDVYRAMDAALGTHVVSFGDDATLVVVLSHGIGPHYDGDHVLHEVLMRLDDARTPRSRTRRLRERAIRFADRRRRARERVVSVDGSRRFYRVPNNELYGGIRFNLRGREPRGFVAPGAEADALAAELANELLALTDPASGRPIVAGVWRTAELHPGPAVDDLPDLLVDWVRTVPISGASSPTIGTVRAEYDGIRTGDHRPGGLLLARGPGIAPSRGGEPVRSVDVAPTIAALLGVELPGVEGRPIPDLVAQR